MSTRYFLTDGSGVRKGAVFYDEVADEVRIASYDSTPAIDGYVAISSAGLTSSGIALDTGAVTSGTWTPTFTELTNLDSTPTLQSSTYVRVGSVVFVAIRALVDPTATGTYTFRASLPVTSNFAGVAEAIGTGSSNTGDSDDIVVYADVSEDELTIFGRASGTSSHPIYVVSQYQVIS